MSRILFAWELGANLGHLARDLPVAKQLRDTGHEVVFAVRDTRVATELLGPAHFDFVQAPVISGRSRLAQPPANYAELLAAEGWCDRPALHGHLSAWASLITLGAFDAVIADHAPGALIAARLVDRIGIPFGNGFEIPPDTEPMPSIRPWEKYSAERLMLSERRVLADINAAVSVLGGKSYDRVGKIFGPDPMLATFSELDHYGHRKNGRYAGSIHGLAGLPDVKWPEGKETRVLLYLRPQHQATPAVIAELAAMEACAVCVVPGASADFKARHQRNHLTVIDHPVALGPLVDEAVAMIGYASSGAMTEALQKGVPLLMIPTTVEQYLGARRVEAIGAGVVIDGKAVGERIRKGLTLLLTDDRYRNRALGFAARNATTGPQQAADATAKHVMALIQRKMNS